MRVHSGPFYDSILVVICGRTWFAYEVHLGFESKIDSYVFSLTGIDKRSFQPYNKNERWHCRNRRLAPLN